GDEQVQQKLRRLLGFLSQDTWNFRFVRRHERRRSEAQRVLFSGKDFRACEVALFSGGLDSLAGTAIQMANSPNKPFIAVSASPTNIHFGRQRRQFRIVANALSSPGTHITFKYCMRGGSKSLQEPSRRTRGFAFLVLGAVTSLAAGVDQLTVHENGFGAINLPYDSSLLGVDLTRAMHPTTLRDFSELISFAFAKPFLVRNDCVFSTKAEMCRAPAASSAASAITDTFSCDRLTRSGHHCGYCTSCLLRQLALENAGLQAFDHDRYLIRLTDPLAHPKPHHLHGLAAMSWQAARLRNCFKEKCSWHALLSEFPELQIAAACLAKDFENVTARLSAVYRQHVDEWFTSLRFINFPQSQQLKEGAVNKVLDQIDPRILVHRLQDARKAAGLTQQQVADALSVARTTVVAIEKGERRITPHELRTFASVSSRSVSELLSRRFVTEGFVPQFRALQHLDEEVERLTIKLQEYAEDYAELESITKMPTVRVYPPVYETAGASPEQIGEDVANAERARLGMGDGPASDLRER